MCDHACACVYEGGLGQTFLGLGALCVFVCLYVCDVCGFGARLLVLGVRAGAWGKALRRTSVLGPENTVLVFLSLC